MGQMLFLIWTLSKESDSDKLKSLIKSNDFKKAVFISLFALMVFLPWIIWDFSVQGHTFGFDTSFTIFQAFERISVVSGGYFTLLVFLLIIIPGLSEDIYTVLFLLIFLFSVLGAVLLDKLFGYFFSPRQIIFCFPFLIISVANSVVVLVKKIIRNPSHSPRKITQILGLVIFVVFHLVPVVIKLNSYYRIRQKPTWSVVVEYILDREANPKIAVLTGMERKSLGYYLLKMNPDIDIDIKLITNQMEYYDIVDSGNYFILTNEFWNKQISPDLIPIADLSMSKAELIGNIHLENPSH